MKRKLFSMQGLCTLVMSMMMMLTTGNIVAQTSGDVEIGSGTGNTGGGSATSPINQNYRNFRYQVIYTKAEIEAAGGVAGNVTQLGFKVQAGATGLTGYTVRLANTTTSSLSSHVTATMTQVYTTTSYSATSTGSFNMITFSTPFSWNGTGNILIDICYSRGSSSTSGGSVYNFTATSPGTRYAGNSSASPSLCSTNTNYTGFGSKPQIRFVMQKAAPVTCNAPTNLSASAITGTSATISWTAASPAPANNYEWSRTTTNTAPSGTGTAVSGTSISQTGLSAGTGYYFWLRSKCNATTFSEWISVPFTTTCLAPTVSTSAGTRCGTGSVNLNATASAGTVYWWDAATGGNLLGTGTSFNTPSIATTTTFYASAGQTMAGNNTAQLGAGSKTSTIASQSPFHSASVYKAQSSNYLIKASELLASGISTGYITSLGLDIVSAGGALNTFSIRMGNTTQNTLENDYALDNLNYYYSNLAGTTFTPTAGINTFALSGSGFYWDGTSNVSVIIYWQNTSTVAASSVKYDDVDFYASRNQTSISTWGSSSSTKNRPKLLINGKGLCMSNRSSAIATVTAGTNTYYQDLDGDGYGNASVSVVDCTQPVGYVTNGTDCDDTNAAIYRTGSFYVDADGDGYSPGDVVEVCYGLTVPVGYSVTNLGLDCNDANAAINPGATEICWNGIDDNCDGQQSEGCAPVAVYMLTADGYQLPSFSTHVAAQLYYGFNSDNKQYRISIKNNLTGVTQEIISSTRQVVIPVDMRNFGVSYSIKASAVINGELVPYAVDPITVYAPTINEALVKLMPGTCGTTLDRLNATIGSTVGANAISYTFRARLSNDNSEEPTYYTVASETRHISMTSFGDLVPQYDASYSIAVSYEYYDILTDQILQSGFGEECVVMTPGIPSINLSSPTCRTTLTSKGASIIANAAPHALTYEFRIRLTTDNGDEPTYYTTVPTENRYSTMSSFMMSSTEALVLENNTTYSVSVRYSLMNNGELVWAEHGAECNLTTPESQPVATRMVQTPFTAVAYPNPFANSFLLDVKTSYNTPLDIKVYDMLGRLVEQKQANVNELETLTIGSNYPSGVYNIIVTQNDETKAVRVVKR